MSEERDTFGLVGFVLAAAGSAVGLGNIWKFPYITYENGGGSFVLVYLLAILFIGAPIMLAEIIIGRRTQKSPVGAIIALAKESTSSTIWQIAGWLGIASGFVILSYYSVVAGWTVYYFFKCLGWSVDGFGEEAAANLGSDFGAFLGNGPLQITFHALFMIATTGVVVFGVKGGIERVTKVLMPVLGCILVFLVINSTMQPGFGEAISFLFHVSTPTVTTVLEAVGHAFFTLSLGMGAMITYGSYVSKKDSIPKAAAAVCIFDTVIAIVACIIMFSIIFSVPEAERDGTFSKSATILFTTLPRMFYAMPFGVVLSPLFYLLVAFAALTSTISLLEVVVAYFIDERGWSRKLSSGVVGLLIFLMGIPAALSLGASETLSSINKLGDKPMGVFDTLDYLASNWMLPLGGLLIAVFVGWLMKPEASRAELEEGHGPFKGFKIWLVLTRFVCPLAIAWIVVEVIRGRSF